MQQMGHDKKENNVKNRYRTKRINLPFVLRTVFWDIYCKQKPDIVSFRFFRPDNLAVSDEIRK